MLALISVCGTISTSELFLKKVLCLAKLKSETVCEKVHLSEKLQVSLIPEL